MDKFFYYASYRIFWFLLYVALVTSLSSFFCHDGAESCSLHFPAWQDLFLIILYFPFGPLVLFGLTSAISEDGKMIITEAILFYALAMAAVEYIHRQRKHWKLVALVLLVILIASFAGCARLALFRLAL